jgi:chromate reductase
MKSVAVLVGSLQRNSINLALAKGLEKLASERLAFDYLDLGALPMFNQDLEADRPESVLTLKRKVEAADGVLFVTPEYNRTPPPVLFNALAWASRPYGQSSWEGKPAAIVGASPGAIGAAAAQSVLRGVAASHGMTLMTRPEVYLQVTPGLIAEDRTISNDNTRAFLAGWVDAFDGFVGRFAD